MQVLWIVEKEVLWCVFLPICNRACSLYSRQWSVFYVLHYGLVSSVKGNVILPLSYAPERLLGRTGKTQLRRRSNNVFSKRLLAARVLLQ